METLIYILKAHLLFMILGGIYHFLLRNEKSFTFNRIYLLAIYGVSILAPLLEFKIISNTTFIDPSLFSNSETNTAISTTSTSLGSNLFTLDILLPWIYGILISISILTFLIKFAKSFYRFKLVYRFSKFDYKQQVYWVEDNIPPFTFLNKTLLPNSLKDEKNKELIIRHEEAHRKTFHFFDIICVEILSSVLIFNPLNKTIKKYLVENHEFLADEYACEKSQKSNYIEILIEQTLKNQLSYVSYFAKPTILNRLTMLDKNKKTRFKPLLAALCFTLISFTFACEINPAEEVIVKDENKSVVQEDDVDNQKIDETTIFSVVDNQAEPKRGIQDFYDDISKDLEGKYPQKAISNGVEGVVYIQFVIEKDGSLSNENAVKGIGFGCDEIAVQILKKQGKWIPGKHNGKTVRSQRVIPIRFKIS